MATDQVPQAPHQQVIVIAEKNGLGTSSFVLGILSTIFGLIPILGFITLAAGALGLALGLGNIGRLRRGAATNKVMTTLGVVFSVLGIVLSIIGIVFVYKTFSTGRSHPKDGRTSCRGALAHARRVD